MQTGSVELERLLVASATLLFLRVELRFAAAALDHLAVEVIADLDQRRADRLARRRVLFVGEVAAEAAAEHADRNAATGAAPFDRTREIHFAGGRIDDAYVDANVGFGLLAAERNAAEAEAAAGARGVFFVGCHGAEHEVIRTGQLAHLGAAARAHATGSRKILLFHDLLELGALDHAEITAAGQLVRQHAG